MTRNYFYTIAMMAIMMVAGNNAFAQGRGGFGRGGDMHAHGGAHMNDGYRGGRDMNRGGYDMNRGGYDMGGYRGGRDMDRPGHGGRDMHHFDGPRGGHRMEGPMGHGGMVAHHPYPAGYRFVDGGFLYGWEGRVRYHEGRWGYLRGNDWYWYDTYYEPDYYYAHPVRHFHSHRIVDHVVGTVATAVAVGALISAICH